jgi:phosphoglucosamine mutase
MGKLFGTDGIRGVANAYPMDVETAVAAGRAVAQVCRGETQDRKPILIGQDTRRSGDMLAHAVSSGICSAGMDAALLGIVPTPAVAYLTRTVGAAAGIVISASHNPFADNGIKLFNSKGYKLPDEAEDQIEALMTDVQASRLIELPSDQIGTVGFPESGLSAYIDFLKHAVPGLDLSGLNIVLDCANGATYEAAPLLFRQMGAAVSTLFCDPDGININAQCGSQYPQVLAGTVRSQHADMGLAFDGDGDRLIAVDDAGNILTGDQLIAVCAKHLQDRGQLRNNVVVTTVMSNMGLHQALKGMAIELVTSQVGDRHVMQAMLARDAVLGGEDSGHIIFHDGHTTGDGLMAALRLIAAVLAAGKPLSVLAGAMQVFPQELINVDVSSKPELDSVPQIVEAIGWVEKALAGEGRVLVRYSGTQNKCRVMVEGPSPEITRQYCRDIADVIRRCLAS